MSRYDLVSHAVDWSGTRTLVYRLTPDNGDKSLRYKGGKSFNLTESSALGKFFEVSVALSTSEKGKDVEFADAICSVSLSKNVIKTGIVGLKGTIKEYVSSEDYEISLTIGVAKYDYEGNQLDEYPEEELRRLIDVLEINDSLYIHSDFLQIFGITKVVVTGYQLEQMTYNNVQVVRVSLLSDEDYIIKNDEY